MDSLSLRGLAFAALLAATVAGCTSRTTPPEGPGRPTAGPAEPRPVTPAPGPVAEMGALAGADTTRDASGPDRRCETDSDCAVKNVGNCCGYYPMCVNKDARTDPEGVRAQCERDGLASVCGFPEVRGCRCVAGRCESLGDGAVDR